MAVNTLGPNRAKKNNNRCSRVHRTRKLGYRRAVALETLESRNLLASQPIFDFAKSIGGPSDEAAYDIARDSAGNIYVAGSYSQDADFDPGPGFVGLRNGQQGLQDDGFVAKYSADGQLAWARPLNVDA